TNQVATWVPVCEIERRPTSLCCYVCMFMQTPPPVHLVERGCCFVVSDKTAVACLSACSGLSNERKEHKGKNHKGKRSTTTRVEAPSSCPIISRLPSFSCGVGWF